ncbi:MAG: hypothetical protein J6R64_04605, partial [Lentisphaeria bacterium]|nr:hypothetical protein [Lentisphaeria bacterium]
MDNTGNTVPAESSSLPQNKQENGRGNPSRSPAPSLADLDTERAVIAAVMIDPSALATASTILGGLMTGSANAAPGQKKGKG